MVAEHFPKLEARFGDPDAIGRARVQFRGESGPWYSVAMKREGAVFTGTLPKPKSSLKKISYYIEATDRQFRENRTQEFAADVVPQAALCADKKMMAGIASAAPASLIVGGPSGAAAVPVGFSSSGVVAAPAATAAGAAGGAGGGGGIGTAAVVGIVAGGAAIAGVAVAAGGGNDATTTTTVAAAITPTTTTTTLAPAVPATTPGTPCPACYAGTWQGSYTVVSIPNPPLCGEKGANVGQPRPIGPILFAADGAIHLPSAQCEGCDGRVDASGAFAIPLAGDPPGSGLTCPSGQLNGRCTSASSCAGAGSQGGDQITLTMTRVSPCAGNKKRRALSFGIVNAGFRRSRRSAPGWVAAVSMSASMLGAADLEPRTLDSLLSEPLSPGVIALLVPHVKDARARERWSAGLKDERPPVRAAAARAIGITGVGVLQPVLRAALDKENDEGAAAEEAAALVMVSPATEDGDLLAFARAPFAATLALTLAQVRGAGVRPHLGRIAALGLKEHQATEFFLRATRRGRDDAEEMARAAVRTGDGRQVEGFFAAGRRGGFPVVPDALEAALASSDRSLNAAACWHVAYTKVSGTPVSESLRVAAVKTAQTAVSSATDAGAAFACDVAARTLGSPPTAPGPWLEHLAAADGIAMPSDVIDDGRILAQLTDAEMRAVALRITGSPDGLAKRKGTRDRHTDASAPPAGRRMRLASGFTPGLLADTLRVAGCAPLREGFAAGEIVYQENGRPREVHMLPTGLAPDCHGAAGTLLALALSPAEQPPDSGSQVLLLNLDGDAVACADEPPPTRGPRAPGRRGHITEPRKLRNVNPVYPPDARGVAGAVVIEATIGTSGCVRSAHVLVSPDERLAWAALRAVSHWTYTPTLLDGTLVPVVMTVTVNFRSN
jgi:TonB family protein